MNLKDSKVTFTFMMPELEYSDDYYTGRELTGMSWDCVKKEIFSLSELGINETHTQKEIESIVNQKRTEWVLNQLVDNFSNIHWDLKWI